MSEIDRELLRVAAADVELVDVQEGVEHLDGGKDPFAPATVPDAARRSRRKRGEEGGREEGECIKGKGGGGGGRGSRADPEKYRVLGTV